MELISDSLPFGRLWHGEPGAISNAIVGSTAAKAPNRCKFATYSISAVILPLTSFNVTVSTPASFT
jgi:hypothetical protein